ncbi:SbcC/MukB-like Walker B domain-containing protein [Amycolatopsis sp. NPDC098790]|uniref:SbcC/MukB-like Walker B domain-containing protein n=1 Tax=Amycolatopsis sp. NPDC098790 TaxID=3363939 RepID=UPI00380DBB5F
MPTAPQTDHGAPAVTGRWQPTRAGVLNSWKWADEEFHFADGWLAFIGRNGSGKSLTASQLVTVLLDGDTSQTALSVSGRAAGTLLNRHTDNRDREDKTGVWWLEYGRTEPHTGRTEYLTTGLWLRSSGQALLRAFFLVPGRVGNELILHVDRNPAGIDSVAEQLAAHGGELFTDAPRLKPKAAAHLSTIGTEAGYRTAVRTRVFAPLDEIQYDALLSVLRTLRSVRTAEKISAKDMLTVLTGALPALDQTRLTEIASAMQRIATLETQLADTREQAKKLADTDRVYELYRQAVALTVAAALRSANTEFDNLTRSERAAEKKLEDANAAIEQAQSALDEASHNLQLREGDHRAAETAVRDHAGAELPHKEERARSLADSADAAKERAGQAVVDAATAAQDAATAAQDAVDAQRSLTKITQELSTTAAKVQAEGAVTNLAGAAAELAKAGQLDPETAAIDVAAETLAETPLAWTENRQQKIKNVAAALTGVETANGIAVATAEQHRKAEEEADGHRDTLNECAASREEAERRLEAAVVAWQMSATHFPAVPDGLFDPDPVDGRVVPDRLVDWADQQAASIRQRLDAAGHEMLKVTAEQLRDQAVQDAANTRSIADRTAREVARQRAREAAYLQESDVAAAQDAESAREAETEHAREAEAARLYRHEHFVEQLDSTDSALDELRGWHAGVEQWRSALRHLDPTSLAGALPSIDAISQLRIDRTGEQLTRIALPVQVSEQALELLMGFDDQALRTAAGNAGQVAIRRIDGQIAKAEAVVAGLDEELSAVAAELEQARQKPAAPPVPVWRTRADGHPLWTLVDFRPGVGTQRRNACEGALLVAGLLDAVVTSDGRARVGDVVLSGREQPTGRTLADILSPEPESPVASGRLNSLLRSISLDETDAGITIVRTGVLTAAAPAGYVTRHIGATARERARAERVARLEALHAELTQRRETAELDVTRQQAVLAEAVDERDSLPSSRPWQEARTRAQTARLNAGRADGDATDRLAKAESVRRAVLDRLRENEAARDRVLSGILAELTAAVGKAETASEAAAAAAEHLAQRNEATAQATAAWQDAVREQASADEQRAGFPPLTALVTARDDEDEATKQLQGAQRNVLRIAEQLEYTRLETRKALKALNEAVDLGGGLSLPAERRALEAFADEVNHLAVQVRSWMEIVDRTQRLRTQARRTSETAADQRRRSRTAQGEAAKASAAAVSAQAEVERLRELYGGAYEELRRALEEMMRAHQAAREEVDRIKDKITRAEVAAAGAKSTLEGIAPQRQQAEDTRERCLARMYRLVDESVVPVAGNIAVDDDGRPTNLTAALAWGSALLATEPRGHSREELTKLLENRRLRLEGEARKVSAALTRFDRQVTVQTIPGTDWRRAVVAAPDALSGEDLHATVLTLRQTAEQLENDLRGDVKSTLKTSMFTALRREIATRRTAAEDLVRQIRATLEDVRTGVARVGVEVDWKVKKDPDAERMIDLVKALPSDETFEQMYEVLRQRLEDANGETWEARVAHTFDYRAWHEWVIKVTHASFGDGKTETFRALTPRSNPLASFSTGEMRLATMLPLLAAAWSMYEAPGYAGPRLLFVDEMNAAFDPQNVRKLLGLLREWNFDVLSTAPEMSALLKAESGRVMIAQVTQSGSVGVSTPWLWTGSGQPVLVADRFGSAEARP